MKKMFNCLLVVSLFFSMFNGTFIKAIEKTTSCEDDNHELYWYHSQDMKENEFDLLCRKCDENLGTGYYYEEEDLYYMFSHTYNGTAFHDTYKDVEFVEEVKCEDSVFVDVDNYYYHKAVCKCHFIYGGELFLHRYDENKVCNDCGYIEQVIANDMNGSCGENVLYFYDIDTNVLTISGQGIIEESAFDIKRLDREKSFIAGHVKEIVITEGITGIEKYAFKGCENLQKISLPISLELIGDCAFEGCCDPKLELIISCKVALGGLIGDLEMDKHFCGTISVVEGSIQDETLKRIYQDEIAQNFFVYKNDRTHDFPEKWSYDADGTRSYKVCGVCNETIEHRDHYFIWYQDDTMKENQYDLKCHICDYSKGIAYHYENGFYIAHTDDSDIKKHDIYTRNQYYVGENECSEYLYVSNGITHSSYCKCGRLMNENLEHVPQIEAEKDYHAYYCRLCNELIKKEDHQYVNDTFFYCSICNISKEYHDLNKDYKSNGKEHWKMCYCCNKKWMVEKCQGNDGICSVCHNEYGVACFKDINKTDWFYTSVSNAYDKGLMSNTGKGKEYFEPDAPITRGMVATVLHRMAGNPKVTYSNKFPDVKKGVWYSNAIIWAAENKVVSGNKDGNYAPDKEITRQDLAIMLRNYAASKGLNTSKVADLTPFLDDDKVASYAKSAIAWCVEAKLMSGAKTDKGSKLNPQANASRAECAKMFSLLDDLIK